MPPLGDEKVDDQVAGDPGKPAAERPACRVRVKRLDRPGDRAKDFLNQVLGIGFLKPPAFRKLIHQRTIDLGKLAPSLLVAAISQANEQARMRHRCLIHSPIPFYGIHSGAAKI